MVERFSTGPSSFDGEDPQKTQIIEEGNDIDEIISRGVVEQWVASFLGLVKGKIRHGCDVS